MTRYIDPERTDKFLKRLGLLPYEGNILEAPEFFPIDASASWSNRVPQPDNANSPYYPVSVHESPRFQGFSKKFNTIAYTFYISASYVLSLLFISQPRYAQTFQSLYVESVKNRIDALASFDGVSHYSYIAVLVICIASLGPIVLTLCYAYWTLIFKSGEAQRIENRGMVFSSTPSSLRSYSGLYFS